MSARFTTANPGGLPFSVDAPGIDNEACTLGVGAFYDINDTVRVGLTYRGELRTDSQSSPLIGLGTSFGF